MADKYKAVWVSHSSISDFLICPRAYYLRNVYRDPKTGHKISVVTPPLTLGQTVHEVLDELSQLKKADRFKKPLTTFLERIWQKYTGKIGGFKNEAEEKEYFKKAKEMLERIEKDPGPLKEMALKLHSDSGLPYYWLDEAENIILCGKIDWIEYLDDNNIHIIDFKTGKNDEDDSSLQLPIYLLLATNLQKRKVIKASYWYLNRNHGLAEKTLPPLEESKEKVMTVAKRIKLARNISYFKCPKNGCFKCRPLEEVLSGNAEKVGTSEYHQDIYYIKKT